MEKKQLYTALSRTEKYEYIHLDNKSINPSYTPGSQPTLELLNSHFDSDYNDKIYKITFDRCDKLYIGSTTSDLESRLQQHVTTKNSAVCK